jgi:hypothetical protein
VGDHDERWERNFKALLRRRQIMEEAVAYMGGKCCLCPYDRCVEALEFHHVDPEEKGFNIADKVTSFEAIKLELDKCELVCANCHREIHAGLHPGHLVLEDDDRAYDPSDLEVA